MRKIEVRGCVYDLFPYADLRNVDLRGADLRNANLYSADLRNANLYSADLRNVDLRGADLRNADLRNANLYSADLRNANLYSADLRNADLREANLRNADLRDADLRNANLDGTYGLVSFRITPDGAFLAYKKLASDEVAVVNVPYEALRVNAYGSRKIRVSQLRVEEVSGTPNRRARTGIYYPGLIYKPGAILVCDDFDPDPRVECSRGLHVFLTRDEAETESSV